MFESGAGELLLNARRGDSALRANTFKDFWSIMLWGIIAFWAIIALWTLNLARSLEHEVRKP